MFVVFFCYVNSLFELNDIFADLVILCLLYFVRFDILLIHALYLSFVRNINMYTKILLDFLIM